MELSLAAVLEEFFGDQAWASMGIRGGKSGREGILFPGGVAVRIENCNENVDLRQSLGEKFAKLLLDGIDGPWTSSRAFLDEGRGR